MLKKIGVHFKEENIKELNKLFKDIKISYLMDYLLNNFLEKYKNESLEAKNELRKNLQEFISKSKEKK